MKRFNLALFAISLFVGGVALACDNDDSDSGDPCPSTTECYSPASEECVTLEGSYFCEDGNGTCDTDWNSCTSG